MNYSHTTPVLFRKEQVLRESRDTRRNNIGNQKFCDLGHKLSSFSKHVTNVYSLHTLPVKPHEMKKTCPKTEGNWAVYVIVLRGEFFIKWAL
jgi:hypothetical protein